MFFFKIIIAQRLCSFYGDICKYDDKKKMFYCLNGSERIRTWWREFLM
jgi:hypothetical protein